MRMALCLPLWLDKRNRVAAKAGNETYVGAALAFAWSERPRRDGPRTRASRKTIPAMLSSRDRVRGTGRPVVAFRNVFGGTVRDHAITTFTDLQTPGPIYRVSVDDWKTDVCPHHGPSLAISADGAYHVTWFTNGLVRKGLFYAHSSDGGRTFSDPVPVGRRDRNPSHPYLVAAKDALWLAWKEFDGQKTTVPVMMSRDNGLTWSAPNVAAETADASDHPLLVTSGQRVFLSWQTRAEGYRFITVGGRAMKKWLWLALSTFILASAAMSSAATDAPHAFGRGSWKGILEAHAGRPTVVHFWG